MNYLRVLLIFLGLGAGFLVSCATAKKVEAPVVIPEIIRPIGEFDHTIQVNEQTRSYRIFLPAMVKEKTPIIFAFHGGASSGAKFQTVADFNKFAELHGYIVVYPEGLEDRKAYGDKSRHWNDGRIKGVSIDEWAFIKKVIPEVRLTYQLGDGKLFAVGYSNGGLMAFRLAGETQETFTAYATVSALVPVHIATNQYKIKSPLLMINGTKDTVIPLKGGKVKAKKPGQVLSGGETLMAAVQGNECDKVSVLQKIPFPLLKKKKYSLEKHVYGNCKSNAAKGQVVFIKIINGGHGWPDGKRGTFLATEEIFQFFDKFRN